MTPSLVLKTLLVLFSFTLCVVSNAQEHIEQYLVGQGLVSPVHLQKYREKVSHDIDYVRVMAKLMKKEDRKYAREIREELEKEIKAREKNTDTLQLLADILEVNIQKRSILTDSALSEGERSRLINYANKLGALHLIASKDFTELSNLINTRSFIDSLSLVNQAIGMRTKNRSMAGGKIDAFMDTLEMAGLLSKSSHEKLKQEGFPDSVNKIQKIISNCQNTVVLDHSRFRGTREEFNKEMEELQRLTGLQLTDIRLSFLQIKKEVDFISGYNVIEASHQGKLFSYTGNDVQFMDAVFDPYSFCCYHDYKLFNQVLANNRSPYRVYRVEEKNPLNYSYRPWNAYMVMTREQRDLFYRNEHIEISFEDHIDALTDLQIETAMRKYKATGFFSRVSQHELDSVQKDLKGNPVFRYNELISRFPSIALIVDDRKSMSYEEAVEFIKEMARISNYKFNPVNIRVEEDKGARWFRFDVKGKTYQSIFVQWLDPWYMIHDAVFGDLKRKAQFEVLRLGQNKVAYIYITHEDFGMLEKQKLIGDY